MNDVYTIVDNFPVLTEQFKSDNVFQSVVLFEFLKPEMYQELRKEILDGSFVKVINPIMYSYSSQDKISERLTNLFESKELLLFLEGVTEIEGLKLNKLTVSKYEWKDYTVMHDDANLEEGLDVFIDFTEGWDDVTAGGQITYYLGSDQYYTLPIAPNSVGIVHTLSGYQRFVKYVNNKSKTFRLFLHARYRI